MQTEEMFGVVLKNSIDELNGEYELERIGLSFFLAGTGLWVKDGPRPGLNMANRLGVGEAISKHIAKGGIYLEWPLENGGVQWLEITSAGVKEVSSPK